MPTSTHKAARLLTDPFPFLAESDGQHAHRAAIPSNGSLTLYTSPAPGRVHVETQDDLETIDGEDVRSPSPKLDHGKQAIMPPPYDLRPRHTSQLTEAQRQQVESNQKRFDHAVPLISELLSPSYTHYNVASRKATLKRNLGQPDEVHEAEHGSGAAGEHSKPAPAASLKLRLRNPEPKHPKLFIRIKLRPRSDGDGGDSAPPQKRQCRRHEPAKSPSTTAVLRKGIPPKPFQPVGDHTYSTRSKTGSSPRTIGEPVNNMPNHPNRETFRVENGVLHLGMLIQIPFTESKKEGLRAAYKRLFGEKDLPDDWRDHIRFTEGDWVARDAEHPYVPFVFKIPKPPMDAKW